jgi:GNAT superfamily N-acetyltransferase
VRATLRAAGVADLDALAAVERAAGEMFRPLGMDLVADDDPLDADAVLGFVEAGRAWVVADGGEVVGYLLADLVDGCAHVEQVSVHPRRAGRRLGGALVQHLAEWAAARCLPALTLTTYRDVPWNGPYYLSLGFRWLEDQELTPGLRSIRAEEAARGLDRWPRGCMRRELVSRPTRLPATVGES